MKIGSILLTYRLREAVRISEGGDMSKQMVASIFLTLASVICSGDIRGETTQSNGAYFSPCNNCTLSQQKGKVRSILRSISADHASIYLMDYSSQTIKKYTAIYVDRRFDRIIVQPDSVESDVARDFEKLLKIGGELPRVAAKSDVPEDIARSANQFVHFQSVRNEVIAYVESQGLISRFFDGVQYLLSGVFLGNMDVHTSVEFADGSTVILKVTSIAADGGGFESVRYEYVDDSARDANGLPISSGGSGGGGSTGGGGSSGGGSTTWHCAANVEGEEGPACCNGSTCIPAECDATGCYPKDPT